jgi:hypothetical protein
MVDWVTISALATASGTLVLAAATFASVRSANRAARVAEQAFLMGQRPLVIPSRLDDPPEKLMWGDEHWAHVEGGRGSVELVDGNVYLAMSLRNVGNGTAVLQGWQVRPRQTELMTEPSDLETFRPQLRDLYVPAGNVGFWQAAIRDVHPGAGREPSLDLLRRSALEPRSPEPALTAVYVSITESGGRRRRDRIRVAMYKPPAAVLSSEDACAPQGMRRDFLPSRDAGSDARAQPRRCRQ